MIQTVIGINSAMMQMPDKKRKKMDYKRGNDTDRDRDQFRDDADVG